MIKSRSVDKDKLRNLLGRTGDFNPGAAAAFGKAYLDSPDTTGDNLDPTFKKAADSLGLVCNEVGSLVKKALENSPIISCEENQLINARFIRSYITNTNEEITPEQIWSTFKHADNCHNKDCRNLHNISTLDNVLSPEVMGERFGKTIIDWFQKHPESTKSPHPGTEAGKFQKH